MKLSHWIDKAYHFLHQRFIWILLLVYGIAAIFPHLGLWIRDVRLGSLTVFGDSTEVTLPMVMLSLLLMNAGLGVPLRELGQLTKRPLPFFLGLVANLAGPLAYICLINLTLHWWHNSDEVQNILVGLALVASMPIAGSSSAWSQNANGNMALSLGLVLFSTLLSPWTTPIVLNSVGWMATGDYSEDLHTLATYGTASFLSICVIAPSLIGILGRQLLGDKRTLKLKSGIKLANLSNLLLLIYSNASVSLPQTISHPDWDLLLVIFLITTGLCVIAFGLGWVISKATGIDKPNQVALMFGLGMNNNGTGLVLASMRLSAHPLVMVPIIFYNLVQHIVAGWVDFILCHKKATPSPSDTSSLPPKKKFKSVG